ncbi:hypothetical protein QBC45DRAFT_443693 [Copromyces sp. CBS 386.78]|nr:hypothetical protein QBC45DRAFT_443693 [Copromyces sp. CBS 386.78]
MPPKTDSSEVGPFTPREVETLVNAFLCMPEMPVVDYVKLASLLGMANHRSASNAWSGLKKKIAEHKPDLALPPRPKAKGKANGTAAAKKTNGKAAKSAVEVKDESDADGESCEEDEASEEKKAGKKPAAANKKTAAVKKEVKVKKEDMDTPSDEGIDIKSEASSDADEAEQPEPVMIPATKKRGRPAKAAEKEGGSPAKKARTTTAATSKKAAAPKKAAVPRGRAAKAKAAEVEQEDQDGEESDVIKVKTEDKEDEEMGSSDKDADSSEVEAAEQLKREQEEDVEGEI